MLVKFATALTLFALTVESRHGRPHRLIDKKKELRSKPWHKPHPKGPKFPPRYVGVDLDDDGTIDSAAASCSVTLDTTMEQFYFAFWEVEGMQQTKFFAFGKDLTYTAIPDQVHYNLGLGTAVTTDPLACPDAFDTDLGLYLAALSAGSSDPAKGDA